MALITALELKQEFYRRLNESPTSATTGAADNQMYPRASVLAYLNQAKDRFTERIAALPGCGLFRLTANANITAAQVALPADFLCDLQVVIYQNSARVKTIEAKSEQWLDERTPTWRDQTALLPDYYVLRQNATTGAPEILCAPAVTTTVTNGFKFYYTQKFADMSADADAPLCLYSFPQIQRTVFVNDALSNLLHYEAGEEDDRSRYFASLYEIDIQQAYKIAKRLVQTRHRFG